MAPHSSHPDPSLHEPRLAAPAQLPDGGMGDGGKVGAHHQFPGESNEMLHLLSRLGIDSGRAGLPKYGTTFKCVTLQVHTIVLSRKAQWLRQDRPLLQGGHWLIAKQKVSPRGVISL